MASKIALAMAAAIGALDGSPPPRAGISGRLIKTISMVRHIGKSDYRITVPIESLDSSRIKFHLFHQRAADALNNIPLDLIFESVGIDDESAVVGKDETFDRHVAGRLVDLHFGDGAADRIRRGLISPRRGRLPSLQSTLRRAKAFLANGPASTTAVKRFGAALVFAEVAQAKLHRIDALVGGDFVHERLAGKTARDVAGSAQVTVRSGVSSA